MEKHIETEELIDLGVASAETMGGQVPLQQEADGFNIKPGLQND